MSPWIREAQRAALRLPHTGFVSTADIGCGPDEQTPGPPGVAPEWPKCVGVHSPRKR